MADRIVMRRRVPFASHTPTPRSEPIAAKRIQYVSEVATIFIKTLIPLAQDFHGMTIQGAMTAVIWVIVPATALENADTGAGVNLDRTQLVQVVGLAPLFLSLISIQEGLIYVFGSSHSTNIGWVQRLQTDDKSSSSSLLISPKKKQHWLPVFHRHLWQTRNSVDASDQVNVV